MQPAAGAPCCCVSTARHAFIWFSGFTAPALITPPNECHPAPQANIGRVALTAPRCGPPLLPLGVADEGFEMPWQHALGPLNCSPVSGRCRRHAADAFKTGVSTPFAATPRPPPPAGASTARTMSPAIRWRIGPQRSQRRRRAHEPLAITNAACPGAGAVPISGDLQALAVRPAQGAGVLQGQAAAGAG